MYSQNKKAYHVFDFANFHERGLSKLKTAFKRLDQEVTGVTATNRPMKRDGLMVKQAEIFFLNGQKVTLMIGDQGDVISAKVNTKILPIKSESLKSLVEGLSDAMKRNQSAFDKSLTKKVAKQSDQSPNDKPASRSQAARIKEIDELITEAEADLQEAKERLQDAQARRETLKVDISSLKDRIGELNKSIDALIKQKEEALGVPA